MVRTYAVEYGDSWATTSNSSRKAMGNCVSPNGLRAGTSLSEAPFRVYCGARGWSATE